MLTCYNKSAQGEIHLCTASSHMCVRLVHLRNLILETSVAVISYFGSSSHDINVVFLKNIDSPA